MHHNIIHLLCDLLSMDIYLVFVSSFNLLIFSLRYYLHLNIILIFFLLFIELYRISLILFSLLFFHLKGLNFLFNMHFHLHSYHDFRHLLQLMDNLKYKYKIFYLSHSFDIFDLLDLLFCLVPTIAWIK